jgi:hypothetical protein
VLPLGVVYDGLLALGILKGKRNAFIKKETYRRWFMHGTSHWLGMDVHDAGGYLDGNGKPRRLRPGMVLTIEPGLYFGITIGESKKYRGIGIHRGRRPRHPGIESSPRRRPRDRDGTHAAIQERVRRQSAG